MPAIEHVRVRGHRITLATRAGPGAERRCSLLGASARGRRVSRSKACGPLAAFTHVPAGAYRLIVMSPGGSASRRVVIDA